MARKLEMKALMGGHWAVKETLPHEKPILGLTHYTSVVASFTNKNDALLFIAAALPNTEQGMTAEFERWTNMEGLDHIDAEELFHQVAAEEATNKVAEAVQSRRMNWLGEFITRWEGVSRAMGEAFYNAPVVQSEDAKKAAAMAARFDARACADRVDFGE